MKIVCFIFILTSFRVSSQEESLVKAQSVTEMEVSVIFSTYGSGVLKSYSLCKYMDYNDILDDSFDLCFNTFLYDDEGIMYYTDTLPNEYYESGKPKMLLTWKDKNKLELVYSSFREDGTVISEMYFRHNMETKYLFERIGNWWYLNGLEKIFVNADDIENYKSFIRLFQ